MFTFLKCRRYIPLRNDISDIKKKLSAHFQDCSQHLLDLEQVSENEMHQMVMDVSLCMLSVMINLRQD